MIESKDIELNNLPEKEGIIIKATGGFYYIKQKDEIWECRARGKFRHNDMTPLVGDHVKIAVMEGNKGYIKEILQRKNYLVRPPLANLDQLVFVVSVKDPEPNLFVLDKLIAVAERNEIEPVIIFSKIDLEDPKGYSEIYKKAGFKTYEVCSLTHEGIDDVLSILKGKVSAFCGNSGAGKSSLLNEIVPNLNLSTGETSKKLGRGKHTTRHTELYEVEGGLIADTPGFSAIEMERVGIIRKDQIQYCFREFEPFLLKCKFTGCSHTLEKGCAVIEGVSKGQIPKERHKNYCLMYEEAKKHPDWELQNMKTI